MSNKNYSEYKGKVKLVFVECLVFLRHTQLNCELGDNCITCPALFYEMLYLPAVSVPILHDVTTIIIVLQPLV